jgi:poly(A) polymerase
MNFAAMIEALHLPIFKAVGKAADALGQPCYVVGGYVRDFILKRDTKDIDFTTVGDGLALAKEVSKALPGSHVAYFKNFGTAQLTTADKEVYEFVGARKESYRENSRNPDVAPGSLEDDLARRDFTMNAMAISLHAENYGELVDPFNGIEDIKAKRIQTPLEPGKTFSDDPLRMLRGIRFAAQLNFELTTECFQGIRENAIRIDIISKERIHTEFNKIMLADKPSIGLDLLFKTHLLHRFFPELVNLVGVRWRNGVGHKDNFYHTLQVVDNVAQKTDKLWLRWAALLHDIAKPPTQAFHPKEGWTFHGHEHLGIAMVKSIFKRLKLPQGEKMRYVQKLVSLHLRPIALTKSEVTDSALRRLVFDAGDDIYDLLLLCRCDITSKNEAKVSKFLKNLDQVERRLEEVEERDRIRNFQPVLTGDDIMKHFNLKPGRQVGVIKKALKEAILDGKIKNTKEDSLIFAEEVFKNEVKATN